jgi:hydroxyacylglutathione hydrolase
MHYKIHAIDVKNALKNYIWLLEDTHTQEVVAIDPTEAALVTDFCEQHQLELKQIWLTHWHRDHTDGVQGLLAEQNLPFSVHVMNSVKFRLYRIHCNIMTIFTLMI